MLSLINKIKSNAFLGKSLFVLLSRGGGIIITYVFFVFFAKYTSSYELGVYDLINKSVLFIGTIILWGANSLILQYSGIYISSETKDNLIVLLKRSYVISVLFGIFTIVLLFLLSFILLKYEKINTEQSHLIKIVSFIFPLFSILQINLDYLRANNKIFFSEFIRNIPKPIFSIILLLIFIQNPSLLSFKIIFGSFLLTAIISFIPIISSFRKNKNLDFQSLLTTKNHLKEGFSLMYASVVMLILSVIDSFMISRFDSIESNGVYSIVIKLALPLSLILHAVNQVTAPKIAEYFQQKNKIELQNLLNRSMIYITTASIPIALIITIFGKKLLAFFGNEFIIGYNALLILIAGQVAYFLCAPVGIFLTMSKNQIVLIKMLSIAVVINIILNVILIPLYSIVGVAIATSVSITFWNIIGVIYIYKKYGFITIFHKP